MTNEHLEKLLRDGEGIAVEFKKNTVELGNTVFETVSSFSNRYGGYLLLGVNDDGAVLGVNRSSADSIKRNFINTLNNPERMTPTMYLSLEEAEIDGKLILYAYVPVSSQIQMFAHKIYDRNEDGDFDITGSVDLVAQLSIRKSSSFTERKVFPYATTEDLLLDELMPLVRNMAVTKQPDHPWRDMPDMEILQSAGLYEKDRVTGIEGFNLAAIMLFGRENVIQQASPGYITDCLLRIQNLDRYDDRERVDCNLIQAFDRCMAFIRKHTIDPFYLDEDMRNVSVRDKIAKELVSNILVHREFSSSMPARIVIEKDRIVGENWSRSLRPGHLDPGNFEPYPKNPIIARFFVNIGNADTLGSGVRNLFKYSKPYSGANPELIEGDVFKTIIPLPKISADNVLAAASNGDSTDYDSSTNSGTNSGTKDGTKDGITDLGSSSVNPTKQVILELMSANPYITAQEIAASIGKNKRWVESSISALKRDGFIMRTGPNKGGHWEVIR